MEEKRKRRFGDRRDGYLVKDATGLAKLMCHLWPDKTDCEVYLHEVLDATELVKYLEKKNAEHPEYKTTIFHAVVTGLARMLRERPYMNRFIQGRRIYEHTETNISFVAKRRFADGAEESLMFLVPKDDETIDDISKTIYGDVRQMRKKEHADDGLDSTINKVMSLPLPLAMLIVKLVRILDFWGLNPRFLTEGDPNYSSILISNLGSIKCPAVYHHLGNYGTCSMIVTLGTLHKEEITMEDGHREIRDVIDVGATLDERIGDGFYFVRSLRLIKHILAHPELLDRPLGEHSGYTYE